MLTPLWSLEESPALREGLILPTPRPSAPIYPGQAFGLLLSPSPDVTTVSVTVSVAANLTQPPVGRERGGERFRSPRAQAQGL